MKRIALVIAAASALLAACTPAASTVRPAEPTTAPVETLPPASTPESLPFVPATYRDQVNGFELNYPSDWTAEPNRVIGSRGSQAYLFSPGTTAESVPAGGSRLTLTVYQWDPKGDLGAYIAQRRTAWDGSGFKVRDGSLTSLVDGRPASDFFIETPDGLLSYFLLTTVGDQYLQLAGEGDLILIEAIAGTLRPLAAQ